MWKHFGSLAALMLLSAPAHALTIKASPEQELTIEHQWEKLSPCVQAHIQAEGLYLITVVPHNSLRGWNQPNDEPDGCAEKDEIKTPTTRYYIHAQSIMRRGKIVIDEKTLTPEIIMHEFGHWFGYDVVEREYYHAWRDALELDFKAQGKCTHYDNEYLLSPYEAEAEIFAAQFVDKLKMYPDAHTAFPRSNAMMAEILEKACEPSASQ